MLSCMIHIYIYVYIYIYIIYIKVEKSILHSIIYYKNKSDEKLLCFVFLFMFYIKKKTSYIGVQFYLFSKFCYFCFVFYFSKKEKYYTP